MPTHSQDPDFFFPDDLVIAQFKNRQEVRYLGAGKKLRHKLCKKLGLILGRQAADLETCAQAIENIHNATLTHDDVIDQSFYRRGAETFNSGRGNKRAVLLGDYILAYALDGLSRLGRPMIVEEVSWCLKTLVDGEWFQADQDSAFSINSLDYEKLAKAKTGSLFGLCFSLPYLLEGADRQVVSGLRRLGGDLGLYFQIRDDLMDFSSFSQKVSWLDFQNNNPNFVLSKLGERYPNEDWGRNPSTLTSAQRTKIDEVIFEVKEEYERAIDNFKAFKSEDYLYGEMLQYAPALKSVMQKICQQIREVRI